MENKNKIIIGVVVVVVVGVFVFLNFGTESETLESSISETLMERPLRIVALEDWEPFSYAGEDGEPAGISVEFAGRALERLGVEYEIVLMPWPRMFKEGEAGTADAVLNTAYTEEHNEALYFTNEEQAYIRGGGYYRGKDYTGGGKIPATNVGTADSVFFIRKIHELSLKFESLEQLASDQYRVGAIIGLFIIPIFKDAGVNVVEIGSVPEGFRTLASGEIDLYFDVELAGMAEAGKLGIRDELAILPGVFGVNPMYLAFSKNSPYPDIKELSDKFDEEIKKMHSEGVFDEIYYSYIQ